LESLKKLFGTFNEILISDIIDDRGRTLLHEACFYNNEAIAKFII